MQRQPSRCGICRRAAAAFPIAMILLASAVHPILAFVPALASQSSLPIIDSRVSHPGFQTTSKMISSAVASPLASEEAEGGPPKLLDSNGKEFAVGTVVRVTASVKAHQVPPKGYGAFDPDSKAFVPSDASERAARSLVLPVGLRGVVCKLYDTEVISASHPIQVKFVEGENIEEGYDSPVTFLMHFTSSEVECVE